VTKKKRSARKSAAPPALVPRSGPPTNLRPGGPHADTVENKREAAIRAALRRGDVDDEVL
jgi:hypothetical protein